MLGIVDTCFHIQIFQYCLLVKQFKDTSMNQNIEYKEFGKDSARHKMRLILANNFYKGQGADKHEVQLIHNFYCGITPVTQQLWEAVMGTNPSSFKSPDCPVEMVSWLDAVLFCNKLSSLEGLDCVYELPNNFERALSYQRSPSSADIDFLTTMVEQDLSKEGYRLLTDAEWEYAARGSDDGTVAFENQANAQNIYSGSDDADTVAWWKENSEGHCSPVGQKEPNSFELFDMSGNVHEWCWDWDSSRSSYQQVNPTGPKKGIRKILRGGSFRNRKEDVSVFTRRGGDPSSRKKYGGFRIARTKKEK